MTTEKQANAGKRLFHFFVPYVDNFGQDIPEERRNGFINVVEEESCKLNGGYTAFDARGGYMSDRGDVIKEDVTVIETYGENPLPPERMAHCSRYMAQESLIVTSVGNYDFMDYKGGVDLTQYRQPGQENHSPELPN
jgi:hypothetical protein